jgi:hypothetical protein
MTSSNFVGCLDGQIGGLGAIAGQSLSADRAPTHENLPAGSTVTITVTNFPSD